MQEIKIILPHKRCLSSIDPNTNQPYPNIESYPGGYYLKTGDVETWYDEYFRLHRTDGPAAICSTHKTWWWHGLIHCAHGPANYRADGTTPFYYLYGQCYADKHEWIEAGKNTLFKIIDGITTVKFAISNEREIGEYENIEL